MRRNASRKFAQMKIKSFGNADKMNFCVNSLNNRRKKCSKSFAKSKKLNYGSVAKIICCCKPIFSQKRHRNRHSKLSTLR